MGTRDDVLDTISSHPPSRSGSAIGESIPGLTACHSERHGVIGPVDVHGFSGGSAEFAGGSSVPELDIAPVDALPWQLCRSACRAPGVCCNVWKSWDISSLIATCCTPGFGSPKPLAEAPFGPGNVVDCAAEPGAEPEWTFLSEAGLP